MTSIGHIMIGATITAIFSVYTILNICEYVTNYENNITNKINEIEKKVYQLELNDIPDLVYFDNDSDNDSNDKKEN